MDDWVVVRMEMLVARHGKLLTMAYIHHAHGAPETEG